MVRQISNHARAREPSTKGSRSNATACAVGSSTRARTRALRTNSPTTERAGKSCQCWVCAVWLSDTSGKFSPTSPRFRLVSRSKSDISRGLEGSAGDARARRPRGALEQLPHDQGRVRANAPRAGIGSMGVQQALCRGRSPRQAADTVHGLTTETPQFSKSMPFRVANLAPASYAMAAICASNCEISRPVARRALTMST